ncbi:hypothetical protein DM01DRAFT_1337965 [Hesseltinella vesiculosa]|uniref:Citrate transporter-like domain-containing protein n=1 Tax=Hesseltinella vesiculosa TaxID=101127 RepID=A0A1X2GB99_9FUNG|nr:hypothetical protein DM01DRAFT_1337965 [Hesseltinella vesiculosa]
MGVQPYAVLILFYSLAYLCVSLDMTGIYQFLAFAIAKKANGRGTLAFTLFFALTSILSGLTSNDVVILTGTSFLAYFTRVSGVLPTAFMMSEFISANIASMALFIGNPTNVIVSTAFDITFASYSAWMMLPTIGGLVVAYVVLRVVYRKAEYIPPTILRPDDDIEPASFLVDRRGATVGTLLLLTCLGTLIGTSFVKGVSVWMVTLPFAVLALVRDIWYDYCAAHQRLPTATVVVTTANTMVTTATMGSTATTVMDVVDKGTRENESPEPILLEKIAAATSLTPLPSPAPSPPPFPPSPSTSTSPPLVRTSQVPRLMMLETNQDHVLLAGLHELETSDDRDRKKSDSLPDEEELDLGTHSDSYPNEIRASGVPPITPSTAVAQTMDPHRASLATNLPIRTYRSVTLAVLRRLPWTVLPFSLGMFVLVEVLTDVQWTRIFAAGLVELTANAYGAVFGFMALTVLLCQFINNLPATILLTRIIQDEAFQSRLQQSPITQQAVLLAIIAGSNIGACLTLVGSLAGIMQVGWSVKINTV